MLPENVAPGLIFDVALVLWAAAATVGAWRMRLQKAESEGAGMASDVDRLRDRMRQAEQLAQKNATRLEYVMRVMDRHDRQLEGEFYHAFRHGHLMQLNAQDKPTAGGGTG